MDPIQDDMELIAQLAQRSHDIKRRIDKLLEIEAWALSRLPVMDGDAVVLTRTLNIKESSGWWPYHEILVEGSTGVASHFNLYKGAWRCYFTADVGWSVSDSYGRRFNTSKKCFIMDVYDLRLRTEDDKELVPPEDTKEWEHERLTREAKEKRDAEG